ncbi:hypothetical protein PHPALM_30621 [Phytophthora palmivora]|uniref:Reverse transcriptase n=1 Tax=Phytophthora palmivora TaxID=4796 RepID=A0A2P4X4P9_9STRA|nr:hypothetical protein PHPALM_30621 [Phytophthora palmivora]
MHLVVDAELFDHWDVHVSSFGAVPKGNELATAIRLIHDLSHPFSECPNELTDMSSLPPAQHEHVAALARRVDLPRTHFPMAEIYLLKGDVNGAFRHLRQHANDVEWMCGLLPQRYARVVNLSAPFGWTGSPVNYGVFGRAISFLVGRESMAANATNTESFFAYEWVDDHVLIEPNIGARCPVAEDTLRLAMLAIFGPVTINVSKFTSSSTTATQVGLEWDTVCPYGSSSS